MALYQKYRPKTLQEIVGQEFVTQTLRNALQQHKTAHAYLFFGSRGTGKTSTARILAKALNCLSPQNSGDPCNNCSHCQAADAGSFVDMIEVDGASNRKIEHARALIEKIHFAPTLGKKKVYIIDEVHMLTKEAFNALLKTIEEPPEHAVFLLATTELAKVPETIRSRCQTFTFHKFTPEQIAGRLQEIAEKEGIAVENRDVLLYIAKRANGGLRDAIGLFEQLSSEGTLSLSHLQQELGVLSDTLVEEFLEMLFRTEAGKAIDFVSDITAQGLSLDGFIEQILGILREKMLQEATSSSIERQALSHLLRLLDIFEKARRDMRDTPIPTLPLEIAIVSATHTSREDEKKSSWALFSKKSEKESNKAKKTPPPSQKSPEPSKIEEASPVSEGVELTTEALNKHWKTLVQSLPDAVLKGALLQAQASVAAPREISLAFSADSWRQQAEDSVRFSLLQKAVENVFGAGITISCTTQSVILEPVGSTAPSSSPDEKPVDDPAVVSEILGLT